MKRIPTRNEKITLVSPLHNCYNHFYITLYFEESSQAQKLKR